MKDFLYEYKIPIIFALLGLLLAILFMSLGFWKTILVIILVGLGAFVGFIVKDIGIFN
ncbi:DUF2273 domain-containing protein [Floricoccus penangensis]|uniref:DUF2273 domain-containing protein n=1 Tax=Floricoccus penangensis TaxID=1859475 RepID=A0A9Q5JHM5_9LACT|nr:DUF2273 domain-containing protein [Floricoccus penangensis]OFI47706.1 DUF2273 domain-containing protein [Floricoccus penangensis]URZ88282.1 DUF2273 domain-containing protein [Floricoccus penangensis]